MQKERSVLVILALAFWVVVIPAAALRAQTATGTLNVQFQNTSALIMVFKKDPAGAAMGSGNTSAATLNFGKVADFQTPSKAGVTETNGASSFTVSTLFDVRVEMGGSASTSYSLAASLASSAPTGLSVQLDSTTLSTTSQTFSTNGTYFNNDAHTLSVVVSTASSGSGGPVTGSQLTSTINLIATAN